MNPSFLKRASPHIIAIAVFFIVAIIYCKPALDGKVLSQSDVISWKGMAQSSFEFKEKYGHFPLWSESAFSGMPAYTFAMDATSKITTGYLTYIMTFGFPKPINFFLLACICFYILTQALRVNPWIGIMASIGYAYSTFDPVIIAVGHDTQMQAIAYAPAVIAGVLLIYQRKYLLGLSLLSIFFGFQVSTQHLQVVYYTGIMLAFITIVYVIRGWKEKQLKNTVISILVAIAGGAIGFGTYAVSMLPLQEYAKETKRGGKSELADNHNDPDRAKGGLDKGYAFEWSYGIGETFTLVVPGIYGGGYEGKMVGDNSKFVEKAAAVGIPEDSGIKIASTKAYWGDQPLTAGPVYLGAVICFLFILSLLFVKNQYRWAFIAAAIFGIVLAWGKNFSSFNYFVFDHMPFYNKFRAPTQSLFMPQLVFPLMAALGLQAFLFGGETREMLWKKLKSAVYIAGALIVVLMTFYFTTNFTSPQDAGMKQTYYNSMIQSASRGKQPSAELQQQARDISNGLIKGLQADRQSIFGSDLLRTTLLMTLAVVLAGLFVKGKIKKEIVLAGLILLSSYDLLAEGRLYLNEDKFVEPAEYENAFSPAPFDLEIKKDTSKNYRVFDQVAEGGWSQDAHASYYHQSLGGYSPAKLGLYQDIIDSQLNKGNISVYNMLNTKYITQRDPANGEIHAVLNPNAYGPCWLVKYIHFVKDGNEEMRALDSINVRDTAIIQRKFESAVKFPPVPDSTASLHLIENLNDKISYSFSAKTNQFAVFSEVYYDKGWNAYLDGNKTDYCKVDYILRGMSVPAGQHTIEFRFEPSIYKLGNTVSVLSSILAYLFLITAIVMAFKKINGSEKNISTV